MACWPSGQPIGQWVDLHIQQVQTVDSDLSGKNPDLLVNGSTRRPTSYNWWMGIKSSVLSYKTRTYDRMESHNA